MERVSMDDRVTLKGLATAFGPHVQTYESKVGYILDVEYHEAVWMPTPIERPLDERIQVAISTV